MPFSSAKNLYGHLDKAALLALVRERDATIEAQHQELVHAMEQIKKINRLLNLRNKKLFGSASEKHNRINAVEDLDFEELPDQPASDAAPDGEPGQDSVAIGNKGKKRSYSKGHPGRNPLPAHLRREVEHFYPEEYEPTWNREMPAEITERLTLNIDIYVKVDVRHKFARGGGIVIAPCRLEDPFYKYKATTELVCHMMRLRFGLHVPYFRFRQLLPGCDLSYSTLIGWAARAFDILAPLGPLLAQEILKGTKLLSMDETPFKLLDTPAKVMDFKAALNDRQDLYLKSARESDKEASMACPEDDEDIEAEITAGVARGKVVLKGQMWTLLNATTGLVMFQYRPSRATINAVEMISGYQGMLMADAYSAYRRLPKLSGDAIILLSCWSHARRKMLESQDPKDRDPVVKEVIRRIGALYEIERTIKGLSPRKQKRVRKRSIGKLRVLKKYMESKIDEYAPKEAVRMALQYCLNHWQALSAYPHHKNAIIDNNPTERAIRSLTVARKNILFLGSVDHAPGAALLYSMMECCKLQKIDPHTWLPDVMKRIQYCSADQLIDLLPHRWEKIPVKHFS